MIWLRGVTEGGFSVSTASPTATPKRTWGWRRAGQGSVSGLHLLTGWGAPAQAAGVQRSRSTTDAAQRQLVILPATLLPATTGVPSLAKVTIHIDPGFGQDYVAQSWNQGQLVHVVANIILPHSLSPSRAWWHDLRHREHPLRARVYPSHA
jgi:hypothetical protein